MKAFSSLIFTVQKPELYMHMHYLLCLRWHKCGGHTAQAKPAISLFSGLLIHKYYAKVFLRRIKFVFNSENLLKTIFSRN
jgi:hypothetical protein